MIWDLCYLMVKRMQFLKKNLIFGNILGFLGVNWVQKWTKIINFGDVLFLLKHLILRGCSESVCLMKDVALVEISANLSHICRRKGLETLQKGQFHGCCIATKTFENYNLTTTNAALMKITNYVPP